MTHPPISIYKAYSSESISSHFLAFQVRFASHFAFTFQKPMGDPALRAFSHDSRYHSNISALFPINLQHTSEPLSDKRRKRDLISDHCRCDHPQGCETCTHICDGIQPKNGNYRGHTHSCSIPGNNGSPRKSSAATQPNDHMSMATV